MNKKEIIVGKHLSYAYGGADRGRKVIRDISFHVQEGEFLVVLGCNGCGKSTLIKHLNALLTIEEGELTVAGIDAAAATEVWRLRRLVGMVFQNPDNQFVSSLVEEDVAFGLENYEVPRREIPAKVRAALAEVGMAGYERRAPADLSGGQKQRVAIAGVLALDPDILILDEATAMLDPVGRREVLQIVNTLHQKGKTIIMVTHYIEEALNADRVLLMKDETIMASGTPREILTKPSLLAKAGLEPPFAVKLFHDLRDTGIPLEGCPLTGKEVAEVLCRYRSKISH